MAVSAADRSTDRDGGPAHTRNPTLPDPENKGSPTTEDPDHQSPLLLLLLRSLCPSAVLVMYMDVCVCQVRISVPGFVVTSFAIAGANAAFTLLR